MSPLCNRIVAFLFIMTSVVSCIFGNKLDHQGNAHFFPVVFGLANFVPTRPAEIKDRNLEERIIAHDPQQLAFPHGAHFLGNRDERQGTRLANHVNIIIRRHDFLRNQT
jgi:hypothetical protein